MDGAKTFFLYTLGCKVNAYDAQALREALCSRGYAEVASPGRAGLIVVNTCAVTARAASESRGLAAGFRRDHPQARVVAAGCAVRAVPDFLAGLADLDAEPGIAALAARIASGEDAGAPTARPSPDSGRTDSPPPPGPPDPGISDFPRARAVLKVQDGCSHGCTYCIVPRARGPSRSRPVEAVTSEARRLAQAGFREIVISGINLGHYGRDLPGAPDFWDLLSALERALAASHPGRVRLRLSSLDPGMLTQKALDILAGGAAVCPHLHVSLQSADPGVLAAMGRGHYQPGRIADFVSALGRVWPAMALGVDLLTGFPGESEAAFRATLEFCARLPLTYAHVFPYSRRPGTRAATLPGHLPAEAKKKRARALRELAAERKAAFARRVAGLARVSFVAETLHPAHGVCEYYLECRLDDPVPGDIRVRDLVPAAPAAAEGTRLVVRAPSPGKGEKT
ncbi:MiaB/RimO family radical SAM methylthiotransferase [Desulfolutivibrio sulfoxidireducens]|uniref:MiaB/RimO family radical SAM methylthiotransferase n=1 Tax=Desulfolutivibrio sulfoxidireducens TaxID=2773299 RepID=UPI00159CFA16|nr:MiaB/RimO family radical SAM methylthiotransferase [Desulfolutivibrio sulfoxidireducens]QLA18937.1 MiaB/RimO family radical SAM methylthiotransferase [Desulfolutivibrio sulfoxidireducens]